MICHVEITFRQHALDNICVHNAEYFVIKSDLTFKYFLLTCLYLHINSIRDARTPQPGGNSFQYIDIEPNQCPYQVSTFYILRNPRNSPDKILKLMVTMTRSKVKSRLQHDVSHLHPRTSVPTKYQLPTPYSFRDIARTRFYRSRSLRQGQGSNQGHAMTLHTDTP